MLTKKITVALFVFAVLGGTNSFAQRRIVYDEPPKGADSLEIHEGIMSRSAQKIVYKRNGKKIATIKLSAPVMISQAEQVERWGYFQFPGIGVAEGGTLVVSWQMNADSHMAYGTSSGREQVPMISKNGGKSWRPQEKKYNRFVRGYNVRMADGRVLQIKTPKSKEVKSYKKFPKPVLTEGNTSYYLESQLPEDLRGAYLQYENQDNSVDYFQAHLNDPGLLRTSVDGYMPVVWWGNIAQLPDGSLVAGVYPTHYQENNGKISKGNVSFYRSKDLGKTWNYVGRIPFMADGIADKRSPDFAYEEPAFEVLADGTFLCVMRTGSTSPMYQSYSKDQGKTWSKPEPMAANGVRPAFLRLGNGVLVLASGRPGVQLRFSLDGTGKKWTDPIDMIPFINKDGTYTRDVSCGYVSMIETGKDSFYIVYSDFTTKNKAGEIRKSIWGRKIVIRTENINRFLTK